MIDQFQTTSKLYDDTANILTVRASHEDKIDQLRGIEICFHSSLMPNIRDSETSTITYLVEPNTRNAYTVPLANDWCVSDHTSQWRIPLPQEGISYPVSNTYEEYAAQSSFPLFDPQDQDSEMYISLNDTSGESSSRVKMAIPFIGIPTALQISTASSASQAVLSPAAPSFFSQAMSVYKFNMQFMNVTKEEQDEYIEGLDQFQSLLWSSNLFQNGAVNSAWSDPNPIDLPNGGADNYWFGDGAFTDGPSLAGSIARHQSKHGTNEEIKIILTLHNNINDNLNYILGYFNTTWNKDIEPGEFIWPTQGTGIGPQPNPRQSRQIFQQYLDEESLGNVLENINGTTLTTTKLSATTIDNDAFGVTGGQKVSLLVLNLNTEVPVYLFTKPVVEYYTPILVEMVRSIASSKELEERITDFINDGGSSPKKGNLRGEANIISIS